MSSTTYRQELPPPKGYQKIIYERVPLKAPWPTWQKLLVCALGLGYGAVMYKIRKMHLEDELIERRAAKLALYPLMLAENDRAKLNDLKKLRDQEAELMKDVPGWEVGTWFGDPVYKTLGPNDYYEVTPIEAYVHTSPWNFDKVLLHTRFS